MNTAAAWGASIVILAGLLHGSFALPMSRMGKWKWENIWLVYSVVGLLVFPMLLASATVPALAEVYARVPGTTIAEIMVFGFGWGLGSTLFGLGISRIGMALGFAIILGITSSLGSLLPLLVLKPGELWTQRGGYLLAGLALVVGGIIACAVAGSLRERDRHAANESPTAGRFATGLLIAIASGILSPMLNFGFVFGKPVQDAATALGAAPSLAANAIWAPALAAGFLPNAGYALWLTARNRSWGLFSTPKIPKAYWVGASVMGLLWFGGISTYGMGAALMGPLGGVLGWPVFMSMVIVTANVHGALSGEWSGASSRARRVSWAGIGILVLAIVVISFGQ